MFRRYLAARRVLSPRDLRNLTEVGGCSHVVLVAKRALEEHRNEESR